MATGATLSQRLLHLAVGQRCVTSQTAFIAEQKLLRPQECAKAAWGRPYIAPVAFGDTESPASPLLAWLMRPIRAGFALLRRMGEYDPN